MSDYAHTEALVAADSAGHGHRHRSADVRLVEVDVMTPRPMTRATFPWSDHLGPETSRYCATPFAATFCPRAVRRIDVLLRRHPANHAGWSTAARTTTGSPRGRSGRPKSTAARTFVMNGGRKKWLSEGREISTGTTHTTRTKLAREERRSSSFFPRCTGLTRTLPRHGGRAQPAGVCGQNPRACRTAQQQYGYVWGVSKAKIFMASTNF